MDGWLERIDVTRRTFRAGFGSVAWLVTKVVPVLVGLKTGGAVYGFVASQPPIHYGAWKVGTILGWCFGFGIGFAAATLVCMAVFGWVRE